MNRRKKALGMGKSVLCEAPLTLNETETLELFSIADENHGILMEAIKTAYSTAFFGITAACKGWEDR